MAHFFDRGQKKVGMRPYLHYIYNAKQITGYLLKKDVIMRKNELREMTDGQLELVYNTLMEAAIEQLKNKLIRRTRDTLNEMQKVVDVQIENKIGR